MKPTLRTPLLAIHLWSGIIAGLVLIFVAVSGAVLVFRPTLERRLDAARFIVAPGATRLPADELVARGRAANPAAELESVRFYGDPTAPFLVYFKDKRYAHVNPYTGEVLGLRSRYGEGYGWIESLHKYLGLPPSDLGEKINGTFALMLIGVTFTGLVLWWPATRRALIAGLTLNRRLTGRPWHLNLHKSLGFYAALVLLTSAVTSLSISFDVVKAALYPLTGSAKAPLPVVESAPDSPYVGFTAIAREVERLMPGAHETYIPLPKEGRVAAYAMAADAPHAVARSYAWFDGGTGKLLRHQPYAAAPRGFRLYYWMMALHLGYLGGWPVKLLLLFGALSVPVLACTGTASYLKRRAATKARKKIAVKPVVAKARPAPAPVG